MLEDACDQLARQLQGSLYQASKCGASYTATFLGRTMQGAAAVMLGPYYPALRFYVGGRRGRDPFTAISILRTARKEVRKRGKGCPWLLQLCALAGGTVGSFDERYVLPGTSHRTKHLCRCFRLA